MQKVTVKDIKVKEGIKNEKPWKLVIITGDDGSEFTTFDTKAAEVGIGGVIELEPVIKAGKTNFTVFKILQKGTPSVDNGKPGMTPELWAEKDRLERHSMQTMSAFRGIIELASSPNFNQWDKLNGVLDKALDWALDHFTPAPAPKPTTQAAKKTEDTPDLRSMVFADAGKLKTACVEYVKMNLTQIDKETAGYDLTTEKGRKDAWAAILVTYVNKPLKDAPETLFD